MRLALSVIAMIYIGNLSQAKDFSVTDEDQKNIAVICAIAARSPANAIEGVASIANWCVQWNARVQAAEKAPADKQEESK